MKPKRNKAIIVIGIVAAALGMLVLVSWLLISFVLPALLTPKAYAGQQRVNNLISEAGLKSVMTATYSCTGPLPFVEDTCGGNAMVVTDDIDLIKRALVLDGQMDDISTRYTYKGVEYGGVNRAGIEGMLLMSSWLAAHPNLKNVTASIGDDDSIVKTSLSVESIASFSDICSLSKNLLENTFEEVNITLKNNEENDSRWRLEKATKENTDDEFDKTCDVLSEFQKDPRSKTAGVIFQVSGDLAQDTKRVMISNTVSSKRSYDALMIRGWFGGHSLPKGVTLSVY